MDRLQEIFALQQSFDDALCQARGLQHIGREEWVQRESLALMSELAELVDEVNFKWWKNPKPVNEDAVKEELVDILHFFVSMCLKMGMTAQELYDIYLRKNAENIRRQQGRSDKPGYTAPVAKA
ncbi:MAG: dUTPase [Oscillospiraceae bacterium]|jgi:dimeric dUTPase (all-alpha-NTP-PPase superfamily)|nr:dUTPase [Oscillospiraceae bacterium]